MMRKSKEALTVLQADPKKIKQVGISFSFIYSTGIDLISLR
jgi:hypothetical protein